MDKKIFYSLMFLLPVFAYSSENDDDFFVEAESFRNTPQLSAKNTPQLPAFFGNLVRHSIHQESVKKTDEKQQNSSSSEVTPRQTLKRGQTRILSFSENDVQDVTDQKKQDLRIKPIKRSPRGPGASFFDFNSNPNNNFAIEDNRSSAASASSNFSENPEWDEYHESNDHEYCALDATHSTPLQPVIWSMLDDKDDSEKKTTSIAIAIQRMKDSLNIKRGKVEVKEDTLFDKIMDSFKQNMPRQIVSSSPAFSVTQASSSVNLNSNMNLSSGSVSVDRNNASSPLH